MKVANTLFSVILFLLFPFFCYASNNTVSWENISLKSTKSTTFSNDGKYIAGLEAYSTRMGVFNTATGKPVLIINDSSIKAVYKLFFLPDNEVINAVVWDKTDGILIKSWNLEQKSELTPFKLKADTSDHFTDFFVSAKYIVGITDDKWIETFSASDGSRMNIFNEDGGLYSGYRFAMSHDSKYFAGMITGSIFILDLSTGTMIKEIPSNNSYTHGLAFSEDDSRLMTFRDSAFIYDINTAGLVDKFKVYGNSEFGVIPEITPDSKYLFCSYESGIIITDIATKSLAKYLKFAYKSSLSSLSYCPATRTFAMSADFIYLFNFDTGDSLTRLPNNSFWCNYLLYSSDNRSLFSSINDDYHIIDRQNGVVTREFKGQQIGLTSILPGSNLYYYTKDSSVILADVYTGSIVESFNTGQSVMSVAFSHNKKYAVVMKDVYHSFVMDWEKKLKIYDADSLDIGAFSPFDNYMITGKFGTHNCDIRIPKTGESVFSDKWDYIRRIAFSSDKKYIVFYTKDYKIKLYNLQTGKYEKEIQDDSVNFLSDYVIKLSRDNRAVIYLCKNGDVIIRSLETGDIIYKIDYFPYQSFWFDVSPDEKNIAVTYTDGSLIQYEIPGGILGVEEEKESATPAFSISPNPSTGIININAPESVAARDNTIEIFDQSGKLVSTAAVRSDIDISTLPTGVYYVRLNGNVQKIVKIK